MPLRPLSRRADRGGQRSGRRAFAQTSGGGGAGLADWSFPGSAVDFDFQNDLFAQNQFPRGTATSQLTLSRTTVGYAQTNSGLWTSFSSGQLRQTDKGLLVEPAISNNLLWCRDLTNAAWVKGATATVALNQVGIDGSANSATLITGGAVTATNIVTQAVTLVSAADTYGVWLKRVTGSGTIEITMDNVSWTAVVPTATWQLFQIQQTLANPTAGIRITTNGDQIAADFSQLENSVAATSPILTTTVAVTRNADQVTLTSPGVITTAAGGTWFVEWRDNFGAASVVRELVRPLGGSNGAHIRANNGSGFAATNFTDGTNASVLTSSGGSPAINGVYRLAATSVAGDNATAFSAALNAVTITDSAATAVGGPATAVGIGNTQAGAVQGYVYLRRVAWFPGRLSNAQLVAWAQGTVGP